MWPFSVFKRKRLELEERIKREKFNNEFEVNPVHGETIRKTAKTPELQKYIYENYSQAVEDLLPFSYRYASLSDIIDRHMRYIRDRGKNTQDSFEKIRRLAKYLNLPDLEKVINEGLNYEPTTCSSCDGVGYNEVRTHVDHGGLTCHDMGCDSSDDTCERFTYNKKEECVNCDGSGLALFPKTSHNLH